MKTVFYLNKKLFRNFSFINVSCIYKFIVVFFKNTQTLSMTSELRMQQSLALI